MSEHLTPLTVAERLIGRPEVLASICGLTPKSGYHWRRASKGRRAGDFTSSKVQRKLLDHSRKFDLGLTADHLIYGATEEEIADIIARRAAAQVAA